ncbi:hypothetical protein [Roseimicrobium sp. ORNL1]|uniref:hypothetical protein n=1 Tax=Roseimicrobium sp. ORNL1 TaxID=2711231 RepID=UPI0013E146C4|nr:hypothetical protein [Roseimicrobium sp. ORNL1]QIF05278.1 hypothetical protein G5S37_28475 [Roseimicrobium sp. ORNL1]
MAKKLGESCGFEKDPVHGAAMSDAPASSKEKVITCCLGLGLLVLAFAVVVGLGLWTSSRSSTAAKTPDAPSVSSEEAWQRREVVGAALDIPFKLENRPDTARRLMSAANEVKPMLESVSMWEGEQGANKLRVGLNRIEYKAGIVPNLDGAIRGAISNSAAKLGDTDPKYSATALRISNLDARKAVYHTKIQGADLRIDVVVVARGSTMWQLQIFLMDPTLAPVVDRVVASLEVLPP